MAVCRCAVLPSLPWVVCFLYFFYTNRAGVQSEPDCSFHLPTFIHTATHAAPLPSRSPRTERPVSARSARRLATTPGAAALSSLGFGITLPAILLEYPRHPPNTDEDSLLLEDTCRASLDTASYLFYVERCGVHLSLSTTTSPTLTHTLKQL